MRSMPIAGGTRDDGELGVAREEDGPAGGMRWISSGRWYKEDGPPVVGGNGASSCQLCLYGQLWCQM